MMIMELQQDNNNNNQLLLGSKDISQIIKGKRKKRQRPLSPLALTMSASANLVSTSSTEYQGIVSNSSPTTSTNCGFAEISCTAEEEEDMANCLILLAQGHSKIRKNPITQKVVFQSEKVPHEISVIGNHNKSGGTSSGCGLFVYQCKTCDRCFASFQALGGHRASHKKPKFNSEGNNKKALLSFKEQENNIIGHHNQDHQFDQNSTSTDLSLLISNRVGLNSTNKNKPKVHECTICRAEFTSGQALGGHMRRHRSFTNTQTSAVTATATTTSLSLASRSPESDELKKSRNMLQLDLNLPAPEDDCRESKFSFTGKEQVMVFSHASPLVDCHY